MYNQDQMQTVKLPNTLCPPSYETIVVLSLKVSNNETHGTSDFSSLVKANKHGTDLICYAAIPDKLPL